MIMEFEENFLDVIISECTSNTLFDEYINYEQIVSESIVLSESQEIKLKLLREFSMKDIGKRLADAFKAIKTFISNLILKLSVFIKNIGKEEAFRNVGKALTELSPEERKETIEYDYCNKFEVTKNASNIKKLDNCINYVMKVLKSKDKNVDASWKDIKDKCHILDSRDFNMVGKVDIEWETKSGTRIEAYKHYTVVSKRLDEVHNYYVKLSNKISSQADKLEKLANYWITLNSTDFYEYDKIASSSTKKILLPIMKDNVQWLKKFASVIANENKRILTNAIGLIKGDKSKIKNVELNVDNIKDLTNESYTPWNDL